MKENPGLPGGNTIALFGGWNKGEPSVGRNFRYFASFLFPLAINNCVVSKVPTLFIATLSGHMTARCN